MNHDGILVVDVKLLPLELQAAAQAHLDGGLIPQARRGEDDQWRVAWTDPERDVFPDERDVWVGWMRVVFPPAKRGVWR